MGYYNIETHLCNMVDKIIESTNLPESCPPHHRLADEIADALVRAVSTHHEHAPRGDGVPTTPLRPWAHSSTPHGLASIAENTEPADKVYFLLVYRTCYYAKK